MLRSENMMMHSMSKDDLANDSLVLEIYFSSLGYIEITSQPSYRLTSMLSDIGGALGLLLGCTVLTVYELLEFAVRLAYHVAVTRRRPTQPTNNIDSRQTTTSYI